MPTAEKMDKASFLIAAVDYIRKLQVGQLYLCNTQVLPTPHSLTRLQGFATAESDYARRAPMLMTVATLQDQMQQLLASGAISKLPEEVQWNVRVLLPRAQDMVGAGPGQAASGNLGSVQNLSAGMLASLPLAAAPPQTPPTVCVTLFLQLLQAGLPNHEHSAFSMVYNQRT